MMFLLTAIQLLARIILACSDHHHVGTIDFAPQEDGNDKAAYTSDVFSGMDREDVFVLECQIEAAEQRQRLYEMLQEHDLDLWSEGIPHVGASFKMLLEEPQVQLVMAEFSCHKAKTLAQYRLERLHASKGSNTSDSLPDFITLIAYKTAQPDASGFFSNYQSYLAILNRLDAYNKGPNKALISKFGSLGKSVNNRSLPVMHIRSDKEIPNRHVIWLSGGQHAREWVAVSSVMYVIDRLLAQYSVDPRITRVLDSFEFAIAPCLNPDGYEWSRTKDRLWRKNRSRNSDGSYGVDLNRNWDAHWAEVGSSRIPGTQTYHGSSAMSEPEVRFTGAYIRSLKNRAAGVDVHSFGQLVLRNYGWTVAATSKESYLKRLGDSIAASMNSLYGSVYTSQRSSALYPSGGSMDDWMFDKAEMPGFTIELRDHGEFGFVLPPEFIVPTGEELLTGVLALAEAILDGRDMK